MAEADGSSKFQTGHPSADILLVTVTEVEARAVLATVEKTLGYKCEPLYIHKTYYDLGLIGGARTFMVRSEMGSGGAGGSLATVQAGIQALHPSSVVMVGIAFGVNPKKQRIGDILISQQLQEYELQRLGTGSDGGLVVTSRGERVGASPQLLDRFRDGALHWKGPKVQFGLILSGEKLIDNKRVRNELLRLWPEAIGGEMEGAGVHAAASFSRVDWIVVKAICDWADGRKQERKSERQGEAARNAASFVIHVIGRGGFVEGKPSSIQRPSPQEFEKAPMPTRDKKTVLISYSSSDADFALEVGSRIEAAFGKDSTYVDLFDLDGNVGLGSMISASASADNWFIILASEASMRSRWITYEARWDTFIAIERKGYHILTVKLDDSRFPRDLDTELRSRKYLEIDGDLDQGVERITSVLASSERKRLDQVEFFVDRGSELDQIELAVARDKVIYILGVPGIGKASLIRAAAGTRFHRDLLEIDIRVGHDLELLSRQIIAKAGYPQPSEILDDTELAQMAAQSLVRRVSDGAMLLIDNAQNAMDDEGNLRPYLRYFLKQCIDSGLGFPVFLASSRRTEILPDEVPHTIGIRINRLSDDFMMLITKHWYSLVRTDSALISEDDLRELVEQLEGYPLAAKMITGHLAFESPRALLGRKFLSKFKRGIAEFIVMALIPSLSPLEVCILQSLAIFGAGMTTELLMGVKQIREHGLDKVQESLSKLSGLMLIVQNVDIIELHPIVAAYFMDQSLQLKTYKEISHDLADISWKKTQAILRRIDKIPEDNRVVEDRGYVNLTRELLRIAEPAHRLLLIAGQRVKAEEIPYRLRGHLREMVFVMYQQVRDYKACIEFATQWLRIESGDSEVRLYQARAHRRLGEYEKAQRLLNKIEHEENPFFVARVFRERGMLADTQGDLSQAIEYFRAGRLRRANGTLYYSQINVDLAISLIAQADQRLDVDQETQAKYAEAVELLREAREFVPRFEENYLDLFVNAQVNAGQISKKQAIDLLKEALEVQIENARLYFRVADMLSDDQSTLEDALKYATRARELGNRRAITAIAKIQLLQHRHEEALRTLSGFIPENLRDKMVCDVLRARALCRDPDRARQILSPYMHVKNSFVACARVQTEIYAAEQALERHNYKEASDCLQFAGALINEFKLQYDPRLFDGFAERIAKIRDDLPPILIEG